MKTVSEWQRLIRRSALIMPANKPKFVERAAERGADAVVLDLEDSIPGPEKNSARKAVRDMIPIAGRHGTHVLVRINKPLTMAAEDLDAAVWPGLTGIACPKVESSDELRELDQIIERRERERHIEPGSITLAISIESALGAVRQTEILAATPRLETVAVGPEDLSLDLGIEPTPESWGLFFVKAQTVLFARVAGVQPMGVMGSIGEFKDLERFERSAIRARELGCLGSNCIHPAQIPILNRVFSPSHAEVERAQRVIDAFEAGLARGTASVAVEGTMVDTPVVDRARAVLARDAAVAAREQQLAAAIDTGERGGR